MIKIKQEDLLTPYKDFEKKHNITQTRQDIPREYLGFCPSKYYETIDMNVEKLALVVDEKFKKFALKNPRR